MKARILRRLCLAVFCLLLCCPTRALATGVDVDRSCSLTLHYTQQDQGLEGLEISLHRVGNVFPIGTYNLVMPYGQYPVHIQGLTSLKEWQDAAITLKGYIARDQIPPDETAVTDETGAVSFPQLRTGLYLVSGLTCETETATCHFGDFLLFLPRTEGDSFNYHVDAKPKFSQIDPKPMEEYSVLKLWQDQQSAENRPEAILVDILKNGQLHESVALNEENNWFYSWSVPAGDSWTVVEQQVPEGYTVTVSSNVTEFVITNTAIPEEPDDPDDPGDPDIPHTGDTSPLMLYILLLCLSGFGLLLLGLALMRGKKHAKKS